MNPLSFFYDRSYTLSTIVGEVIFKKCIVKCNGKLLNIG